VGNKYIIIVLLAAVALSILFYLYSSSTKRTISIPGSKEVTLNYWGLFEDEDVVKSVIASYQNLHPKIRINYEKQTLLNYRTRLQTQLRAGQGPDIFRIHSSWLPMFLPDLSIVPGSIFSETAYPQIFYPSIKEMLSSSGRIYAVPLETDSLVLYYNEEILHSAGVTVPRSWEEFRDAARKVTVKGQNGQIQTAGAALGTTNNVDFWPEIIALLFLQQPTGNLLSPANPEGAEVLQFYSSFVVDPRNKTWDDVLPASTEAFAQGKLAFLFAPVRQARVIKQINLDLPLKAAPVPQLAGKTVALGGFWAESVSVRSVNQKEAWEFLKFLTRPENLQLIQQQQIDIYKAGQPFPRADLAWMLNSDPVAGAAVVQTPYYKGWYLNSGTQDAGLNEEMIRLYGQAVDAVRNGQNALSALQTIQGEVQQVILKYGVK